MKNTTYTFDLPTHHKSIIKVIGVGGGGSNAVNNMYKRGIKDVAFVVCNTDVQALQSSPIPHRLQIGAALTSGLGAGANPEVGRNAALESKDNIRELLEDDTKMLFITAGMGGGTGTGAAPVIAGIAQKQGILTVGIVTLPFSFEGKKKLSQAQEGIRELRKYCDTVLIILNDKIQTTLGALSISQAFLEADNVLTTAAKSIAEIITVPGYVNVDFEDVKTVMKNAGAAVMGSGEAEGEGRALQAAEVALSSPLLDCTDIRGAKKILLSIVSGQTAELQMDELTVITNYIQTQTGEDAEVIFGHGSDPAMSEQIRVTVIATGFQQDQESDHVTVVEDKKQQVIHMYAVNKEDALSRKQGPSPPITDEQEVPVDYPKPACLEKKDNESAKKEVHPIQLPLPFGVSPTSLKKWGYVASTHLHNGIAHNWDDRYVKEQLSIPAYLRKKIQLDPLPNDAHASQGWLYYQLEETLEHTS